MSPLVQLVFGCAAFGCLCLSMDRHARHAGAASNPVSNRRLLRWTGWLLMGLVTLIAVALDGWGLGLVNLLGALSLSATLIIVLASYRPKWLIHAVYSGGTIGVYLLASILNP